MGTQKCVDLTRPRSLSLDLHLQLCVCSGLCRSTNMDPQTHTHKPARLGAQRLSPQASLEHATIRLAAVTSTVVTAISVHK
ncbi:uncharacterized protein B0I36DRAFT_342914 [Microdochium trichocladiopsis]|uniref:Uncharacterized protein n=1 Tax=Microdochium trichocladiopsis TaxID=1682393 RepID=A0A9P8XS85_9PEZI|nr:uncharacterized protein B0I36DRAFT_342914 [Microdochium trichocladiopsis]KAH7009092.1 hypothetical protein B0I36DRAFT_342914 [Microdochium trichocladiopsis]